jgi:ABC-type antimicrobial peptide transport system permease subunit
MTITTIAFWSIFSLLALGIIVSGIQSVLEHFENRETRRLNENLKLIKEEINLANTRNETGQNNMRYQDQDVVYSVRETDDGQTAYRVANEAIDVAEQHREKKEKNSFAKKMFKTILFLVAFVGVAGITGVSVILFLAG